MNIVLLALIVVLIAVVVVLIAKGMARHDPPHPHFRPQGPADSGSAWVSGDSDSTHHHHDTSPAGHADHGGFDGGGHDGGGGVDGGGGGH